MDKSAGISVLVEEHIKDGDTIFVGGFGHCVPFALGFEIIRQGKKNLTSAAPAQIFCLIL